VPRPVNADAQATQRKILTSASELFARRGRDGASVRDIARGAGVSLAMVHHYFGSKDGLYEACVEKMLEEISTLGQRLAVELADAPMTAAATFERAVRVGFRFARDNRDAVRLLQRSIIDAGEVDTRVRESRMMPFLDRVSAMLGMLTGKSPEQMRLPLQSGVFLAVRYAIASDRELGDITYGPDRPKTMTAEQFERAVEDHLVDGILAMLGFPPPGGPQAPSVDRLPPK
jgi:AcrR family transcriptional regulator